MTVLIAIAAWFAAPSPAAAQSAPMPARVVAIGDLHGDYSAWIDVARSAGLIDRNNRWAGGKTVLVQLGDITDRGPDSLRIIRHLQQLQREAQRAGGRVVTVLGNHEAMNLLGDLRYVTPEEFAAFATPRSAAVRDAYLTRNFADIAAKARARDKRLTDEQIRLAWIGRTPLGWVEHQQAWGPKGELGQWATRNPAIFRIGDYLFVHGGISLETSARSIDVVNRDVARAMAAADESDQSILMSPLGPLWYRGLIQADRDAQGFRAERGTTALPAAEEFTKVLGNYGAKFMVVGHTPAKRPISFLYDGRLARIDTAMSTFYGGPLSWLEISAGKMIPHTVTRSGS